MEENEISTETIPDDFPQAYIRFRTTLDSLEMTAMRYFLKDEDAAERVLRAKEFEDDLMPIIEAYQSKLMSENGPGECPEGCFECNGGCVPYPCP